MHVDDIQCGDGSAIQSKRDRYVDVQAFEERVKEAQKASRQASWFSELTERDIAKSDMYREAALAYGHSERPVGSLFAPDDELLRACHKVKHYLPFEKHLLLWNDGKEGVKKAMHPEEGATHGPSAALRGALCQRISTTHTHTHTV